MDDLPSFVRPLVISLRKRPQPNIANETWKQQMIQLHSCCETVGGKRSRASRGGVKRKRADTEGELVWSLERLLEEQGESGEGESGNLLFGEEDALILEQLKRHHDGNVHAAESNFLVQLSWGKGKITFLRTRLTVMLTRPDLNVQFGFLQR
jgi:hypothetical protein